MPSSASRQSTAGRSRPSRPPGTPRRRVRDSSGSDALPNLPLEGRSKFEASSLREDAREFREGGTQFEELSPPPGVICAFGLVTPTSPQGGGYIACGTCVRPTGRRENPGGRRGIEDALVRCEAAFAVEHDAHRRAVFQARQPTGERRVVRLHRAAADQDRVEARAQRLHVPPRDAAGHGDLRLAFPADRVIRRNGKLQKDIRPAVLRAREVTRRGFALPRPPSAR